MTLFSSKYGKRPSGRAVIGTVHEIGSREYQQDSFGTAGKDARSGILAVVADGMGGLVNSDQVSNAVVDAMLDAYAPGGELAPQELLLLLLQRAVASVKEAVKDNTYQSGSTLASCMIRDGKLSYLCAGDSRVYLWRRGGLIQLSRDHDFAYELTMMRLRGELSAEEVEKNPRKGALTSFVSGDFPQKLDYNSEPVSLQSGDKVLLVSDGVYRALTPGEMARYLRKGAKASAKQIQKQISKKKLPQQDNFTAVVIELK